MKKHLFPVFLWGALCVTSPATAQEVQPAAQELKPSSGLKKTSTDEKPRVDADRMVAEAKAEKSASALRAEQAAFKPASVALAPDSMTRPKGEALVGEDGLRVLKLRRARAQAIQTHAADLKRELAAQKGHAKHIKALDGLIADAKAVEAGVVGLIGEDGKRAFDAGDGVSKKLSSSDAQAKKLEASLASTLKLVESALKP